MAEILNVIDLTKATFDLAKQDPKRFTSKHVMAIAARNVQRKARRVPLATALPYEGAFLTCCAEFERGMRDLLESFAATLATKINLYANLPDGIRGAHLQGAARVLVNIRRDKFKHLVPEAVVAKLAGCMAQPAGTGYTLVAEAFSDNERNFKHDVIAEHMKRVGVGAFWTKAGAEPKLAANLGTASAGMTSRAAMARLDSIMNRRNQIIHRGKGAGVPGESEVREAATFFTALIWCGANVLVNHLNSL